MRRRVSLADSGDCFRPDYQSLSYRLRPLRPYRIATACKGASGAIPAIASSPATLNAWPPRAALTPIAVSIPGTCSHAERSGAYRDRY